MSDPELESGPRWDGDASQRPFHVVVKPTVTSLEPSPEAESSFPEADDSFSLEEIEAAYLRALEAADLMEGASLEALASASEAPETIDILPDETEEPAKEIAAADATPEVSAPADGVATASFESESCSSSAVHEQSFESAGLKSESPTETRSGAATSEKSAALESDDSGDLISAHQVLEALLFVGGAPLSTKKLLEVLTGSTTPEQLDAMLMELNSQYLAEGRPYGIRLQAGGYVMHLREEFETVRSRTYGQGPKDVKLAQDALEVLAMIAYRQPVTREAIEETGKPNVGPILRQLLRRQLIVLERSAGEDVAHYRSTPRFLTLFGLRSLDDLPQAGDFNFK